MPLRRIRVSFGRTVQTAPYESARLDVSIERDISDDALVKDEVNKTLNGLKDYVQRRVSEEMSDV